MGMNDPTHPGERSPIAYTWVKEYVHGSLHTVYALTYQPSQCRELHGQSAGLGNVCDAHTCSALVAGCTRICVQSPLGCCYATTGIERWHHPVKDYKATHQLHALSSSTSVTV